MIVARSQNTVLLSRSLQNPLMKSRSLESCIVGLLLVYFLTHCDARSSESRFPSRLDVIELVRQDIAVGKVKGLCFYAVTASDANAVAVTRLGVVGVAPRETDKIDLATRRHEFEVHGEAYWADDILRLSAVAAFGGRRQASNKAVRTYQLQEALPPNTLRVREWDQINIERSGNRKHEWYLFVFIEVFSAGGELIALGEKPGEVDSARGDATKSLP